MTSRLNMATHFRLAVVFSLLSLVFLPMCTPAGAAGDARSPWSLAREGAPPRPMAGIGNGDPGFVHRPRRAETRPGGPLPSATGGGGRGRSTATRPAAPPRLKTRQGSITTDTGAGPLASTRSRSSSTDASASCNNE